MTLALIAVAAALVLIAASVWLSLPRASQSSPEVVEQQPPRSGAPGSSGSPGSTAPVAQVPSPEPPPAAAAADRLSEVRRDVRAILTTAFAGDAAAESPVADAVARFDRDTARLVRENWPVLRLVEDLVTDPDRAVGTAAVRYLGVRGDRLSLAVLGTTLDRQLLREEIARALPGFGDAAVPVVARLLEAQGGAAAGLGALETIGSRRAAEALAEAFASSHPGPELRARYLDALRRIGPPATRSLLGLVAQGRLGHAEGLAQLEALEGAEHELALCLQDSDGLPIEILLEATALLQPAEGLAWVEELVQDYEHGHGSLSVLRRWRGPEAIASLLRLDRDGRIPDDLLVDVTRALIQRDSIRFTRRAEAQVAGGRDTEAERLLELLLLSEHPGSARALFVFASSDLLGRESRLMAALAIGEFGQEADVEEILTLLADYADEDRRVLAALLVSVHVVAGPEAVADVLASCHENSVGVVLEEIDRCRERGTVAAGITRVARALDGAFSPDPPDTWDYLP